MQTPGPDTIGTFVATFERNAAQTLLLPNHITVHLLMAVIMATNRGPQSDNCGVNNEHVQGMRARGEGIVITAKDQKNPPCIFIKKHYHIFVANTTAMVQFQNPILC